MDKPDRIYIRDLQLRCIVGIFEEERNALQDVILNIVIETDLRRAGATDRIEDTIDYKNLKKEVVEMVEASDFFLIERLAEAVAEISLRPEGVRRVIVTLDKPGALRFARSVAVEITREKIP